MTLNPPASRQQTSSKDQLPEIVVGKDLLELLSSAMYIDPMTVYREYIQNAADAVDTVRADVTLNCLESGRVDILVDSSTRTVRIRDNGCGVRFRDFWWKLSGLGASPKRGHSMRGFRGVGRLVGLAYAQELIFRSRVAGEIKVSQLSWDCRRLRSVLRDESDQTGVADIIREVTALDRLVIDDAPERFFEVELRGIIRLRNDQLMSPLAVTDYLSQIAPVPFSPAFSYRNEIAKHLTPYVKLTELDIRVNNADQPIYRPHRDSLRINEERCLNFDSVNFVEVPSVDENIAAVAWVLHHEYAGALPNSTMLKGLRMRTGNIQVSGRKLLESVFPETRFNSWSVGEVHVIDRRIVPNGRRDQFEQNLHYHNLVNHLAPTARDIARRCRTSSVRRKWERQFEILAESAAETTAIIGQRSTNQSKRQELALQVEKILLQLSKISSMKPLLTAGNAQEERIAILREQLSEAMNEDAVVTSPLMRLPEAQRKTYEHFFELVYECSTNRVAAKALIDRILLRLG